MLEAPLPGQDHSCAELVAGFNAFKVALRSAGMNHGLHSLAQSHQNPVLEREKGVGDHC